MTNEELRQKLITRIDALLARAFMVWGEDRELLTALRAYASVADDATLSKIASYMPTHSTDHGPPVTRCPACKGTGVAGGAP